MKNVEVKGVAQDLLESVNELRLLVDETKKSTEDIRTIVNEMKIRVEKLTITGLEISFGGGKDE